MGAWRPQMNYYFKEPPSVRLCAAAARARTYARFGPISPLPAMFDFSSTVVRSALAGTLYFMSVRPGEPVNDAMARPAAAAAIA